MSTDTPNGGTLKEYRTLLLSVVHSQGEDIKIVRQMVSEVLTKSLPKLQLDIAKIQTEQRVKTAIYGFLGGLIPTIGTLVYIYNVIR